MGPKKCPPCRHPADFPGSPPDPEGSQKAPQGTSDDGSDALPKFGRIFDDFRTYFSFENDPKNEPEIVKKYIKIMAKLFYYFFIISSDAIGFGN